MSVYETWEAAAESMGADTFPDWIKLPNPAAGVAAAAQLSSQWDWMILSARLDFVASVAAATRTLTLDVLDPDGTPWFRWPSIAQAVASQTHHAEWVAGTLQSLSQTQQDGSFLDQAAIPRVWIPGGWTVQVSVDSIQAADQASNVRLAVCKRLSE